MGWTYNAPDDTVTHGPVVTAVILAFTIFTFVIVCIRMYVRIGLVKAVGTGKPAPAPPTPYPSAGR